MSLAIYAAPIDYENNINNDDNIMKKRKTNNNKTQKRNYVNNEDADNERILSIMQKVHNLPDQDNENNYSNFTPLPPPSSVGVQSSIYKEEERNNNRINNDSRMNKTISHPSNNAVKSNIESYTGMYPDNKSSYIDSLNNVNNVNGANNNLLTAQTNNRDYDKYYKRFIPNYDNLYNNVDNKNTSNSNDVLIDKLNYMIHLLEEKQDEKTNNVTEEVILYSFLGVFIIFIVDSFSSMKKYTR
jgi:hypothetical protein